MQSTLRKYLKSIFVFCMLVFALNAHANPLDEAKNQGLVGEKQNGYLGAVINSSEAQTLVKEINQLRKKKYLELAAKNNITLAQVEKLAANKTYSKTKPGHFIWKNGKWIKK